MLWGITFFVPVGKPCDSTGLGSLFYFTVATAKSLSASRKQNSPQ